MKWSGKNYSGENVAIRSELTPYHLVYQRNALKVLRSMTIENAERILLDLQTLAETADGDIKYLGLGYIGAYRLRVGTFRVYLDVESSPPTLFVEGIEKRGEAYRKKSRR